MLDVLHDPEGERPDGSLMLDSLRIEIARALSSLTEREKDVVTQYYGIAGTQALSLDEIGEKFDLTKERVRQIREKAIRKLRNSSCNRNLLAFL
jgi:RNA polymerase primary sigma factor